MKLSYSLLLALALSSTTSFAQKREFSPYENNANPNDDIYTIRAKRSAENYAQEQAEAEALKKAQAQEAVAKARIDYGPMSDDDNDDPIPAMPRRNIKLSSVSHEEESDDFNDAEPEVRAHLKKLEKSFKHAFAGRQDGPVDVERLRMVLGTVDPETKFEHKAPEVEEVKIEEKIEVVIPTEEPKEEIITIEVPVNNGQNHVHPEDESRNYDGHYHEEQIELQKSDSDGYDFGPYEPATSFADADYIEL